MLAVSDGNGLKEYSVISCYKHQLERIAGDREIWRNYTSDRPLTTPYRLKLGHTGTSALESITTPRDEQPSKPNIS